MADIERGRDENVGQVQKTERAASGIVVLRASCRSRDVSLRHCLFSLLSMYQTPVRRLVRQTLKRDSKLREDLFPAARASMSPTAGGEQDLDPARVHAGRKMPHPQQCWRDRFTSLNLPHCHLHPRIGGPIGLREQGYRRNMLTTASQTNFGFPHSIFSMVSNIDNLLLQVFQLFFLTKPKRRRIGSMIFASRKGRTRSPSHSFRKKQRPRIIQVTTEVGGVALGGVCLRMSGSTVLSALGLR